MNRSIQKGKYNFPDQKGHFGVFGGRFVAETLIYPLDQLKKTYLSLKEDKDFNALMQDDFANFVGRPTPLYFAKRLTDLCKGQTFISKEKIFAIPELTK